MPEHINSLPRTDAKPSRGEMSFAEATCLAGPSMPGRASAHERGVPENQQSKAVAPRRSITVRKSDGKNIFL